VRSFVSVALTFVLLSPFCGAAQKKEEHQRKISCPPIPHPRLVLQVRPKYPKEAKQAGIEGTVSLHCIIGSDGSVQEIEVIRGEDPFVQAAKLAVAKWKYQPVMLNGVSIESDTTVDVIFQMPRQKSKKSDSQGHNSPQN
jgi:TonB family protein